MTRQGLRGLVEEVQRSQSELASVEVKTACGGTPKRLYEAISAFANCSAILDPDDMFSQRQVAEVSR